MGFGLKSERSFIMDIKASLLWLTNSLDCYRAGMWKLRIKRASIVKML